MTKLENDYERMVPEYHHGLLMYGEHILRYESVKELVNGKVVLDIASGSGYGSASIAETAKKVYGVDVNEQAVAYANERFGRKNIDFRVGNGTDIPLEDKSVDVVVSHETIEHIADYPKFLAEVKRVLKENGQAVISTPNDDEYPPGNHFHLHQFKIKEFRQVLEKYFKQVDFYYQGAWIAAALLTEADFTTEWRRRVDTFKTHAEPSKKATYVIAVCSDGKTDKLLSMATLTEPWSDKHQREVTKARDDKEAELESLMLEHQQKAEDVESRLQQMYNSKTWRYSKLLRKIRNWF